MQARLIDADALIVDAVPKGGAVRYIRQPDADPRALDALLGGVAPGAAGKLEDAFMMMLRQHQDAARPRRVWRTPGGRHGAGRRAARNGGDGPVIVVRDLVRRFGDFTAVASTSFEVARGEIFGLLGPNGAGKTTTFRMLCGLLPATSGHLEVAGLNRTARAQARGRIGYVSQKFALYGNLTVRENLEFFGGAYGLRGQAGASAWPRWWTSSAWTRAVSGLLPGGYKQRLAMAAGLLHEPEILFLDEPTSGIDPLARRAFWRAITALAQSGVTIVITTHFMEEAEYCDRIAIQDAGRMLALGTPRAVRAQAGGGRADMNSAFIAIVEQGRARRRRPGMSGSGFLRRFLALLRKEVRQMLRDKEQHGRGPAAARRADPAVRLRSVVRRQARAAGRGHGRRLARAREAVQGFGARPTWRRPGAPTCPRPSAPARGRGRRHRARAAGFLAPGGGQGGGARVQLVLNGSNSTTAQTLEGYVGGAIGLWSRRAGRRPAPASRWCSACGSTRRASAPGTWCPACWCWC